MIRLPRLPQRASSLLPALAVTLGLVAAAPPTSAAAIATPSEHLGFTVGADRVLADYRQIRSYFDLLASRSKRVQVESLGPTTLGADMFMAVISSEENMTRLPRLKEIARRLSDPRGLSDAEVSALAEEGRAVLLITCNIHSTEIGSSQMSMEWAHALATADDPETRRRLSEVVLLLVPSLNPDGQTMETEWYRRWLGTRYEGGRQPWLYHPYTGHDDNRDWYMLTQKETRAMSRAVYREWYPQVWLDEHQMGNNGPRLFVPPYSEPTDPDIHALIWREVNRMGSDMALRLDQVGKRGVIYGYAFDAYWPGGTKNTAWFKNISGLLTEAASCRIATPVYIEPGELAGGRKGLVEYEVQTNFPDPWAGGWWRLRDIMDYERIASDAIHETCADLRRDLLRDIVTRARAAMTTRYPGEAIRIPRDQRDWASALQLAALLREHGVELSETPNGDLYVPLAQPYGTFIREMLGTQRYPEVKLVPGKDIVRPYDVAAWSLPLMMGVTVESGTLPAGVRSFDTAKAAATSAGSAALLPAGPERARALNAALRGGGKVSVAIAAVTAGGHAWPAGTAFLDAAAAKAAAASLSPGVELTTVDAAPAGTHALSAPRVGLYKPYTANLDEGWSRFVLEQYGFAPRSLDNATIKKGALRAACDAIVLPDIGKDAIITGRQRREGSTMTYFPDLPPEYSGGIGPEGATALKTFVEQGGTLVATAASCDWVMDQFNVPVGNTLASAKPEDFSCPGSLLAARRGREHPVNWGMPEDMTIFVDAPFAFQTTPPAAESDRWVLASYPDDGRDILRSGWITGEKSLERRAAAVAVTYGKGRIVLFGFRPLHRAQTHVTYPLLFNALWWSSLTD